VSAFQKGIMISPRSNGARVRVQAEMPAAEPGTDRLPQVRNALLAAVQQASAPAVEEAIRSVMVAERNAELSKVAAAAPRLRVSLLVEVL